MYENVNKAIEELIGTVDIVDIVSRYISVQKAGQNYSAVCPFHQDTNPSLMISPSKKIFKCFVCNTGGNAIHFVQHFEKINYFDAARKVASLTNFNNDLLLRKTYVKPVNKTLEPLINAINDLSAYYHFILMSSEGEEARKYLEGRFLENAHFQKYLIGYAPQDGQATIKFLTDKGHSLKTLENIGILAGSLTNPLDKNRGRIMFALKDNEGQVVGFSARKFLKNDDGPKYINSPETKLFNKSKVLYNYDFVKKNLGLVKYVYLVEGFIDVIAFDRIGIYSSLALMGTAFNKEHGALLRLLNKEVRIYLDSDEAGQSATLQVMKVLDDLDVSYRLVRPSETKLDPDDLLNKFGPAKLKEISEDLIDKTEFTFSYLAGSGKLTTLEAKKAAVTQMMPLLLAIKSRLELDLYIQKLSSATGFSETIILDMYKKEKAQQDRVTAAEKTIKQHLPLKKTLSALKQAERHIVRQMLLFPEAINYFNQNLRVFSDEVHRYIASYLKTYGNDEEKIDYAALLGEVSMSISDEAKKDMYIEELLQIESELENVKYDENILAESVNKIMLERELEICKRKYEEEKEQAVTEVERAKLSISYNEKRRALLKKYKR